MTKKYLFVTLLGAVVSITGNSQTYTYTGSLQTYTVPADVYTIEIAAEGAGGGNGGAPISGTAGLGASMTGKFDVTPGQELTILVGERGQDADFVGGGGGGTFIWDTTTEELLLAAGGGGGGGATDGASGNENGQDASITTAGTNGSGFSDGAGTDGNGGSTPTASNWAGGGAGWLTSGNDGTIHGCMFSCTGGDAISVGTGAGGTGGGSATSGANGGYGGGGGGNARCGAVGGGGGGGYSGGGCGGEVVVSEYNGGGGGGSFNAGYDQTNTAGVNGDNGEVTIESICNPMTVSLNATTDELFGDDATLDIDITGGNGGYSFDWDNDELDDFDDTEDLTGISGGTYTVIVRDASICPDVTETFIINSQLGIDRLAIKTVVYPNPTTDMVQLIAPGSFTYEVISVNGSVLFSGNGIENASIDLSDMAPSTYFIKVKKEDRSKVISVVKQ